MSKAQIIRDFRRDLGWTQIRLADFLGKSKSIVGKWERGLRNPTDSDLAVLVLVHHLRPCDADCKDLESFQNFVASLLANQTKQPQ